MKRNEIAKLNSAQAATNRFGIGMLTPTLIVLLVMTAYPLIFTFVYSFTDYNYLKGTENASFVLFDNYVSSLKTDIFSRRCGTPSSSLSWRWYWRWPSAF